MKQFNVTYEYVMILTGNSGMSERQKIYFESLLNVREERSVQITTRLELIVFENVNQIIIRDEVEKAFKRLQEGKAAGLDGLATECLNVQHLNSAVQNMHIAYITSTRSKVIAPIPSSHNTEDSPARAPDTAIRDQGRDIKGVPVCVVARVSMQYIHCSRHVTSCI